MKKVLILFASFLLVPLFAGAQEKSATSGMTPVDSIVYRPAAVSDAALEGKSIFSVLAKDAKGTTISQDPSVVTALNAHISYNRKKKMNGYRIRIFFDNSQSARGASEAVAAGFRGMYPGIGVYRTYDSPFFKVTVGNFRRRSGAFAFLQRIKGAYPGAFVMKCDIDYPPVDQRKPFVQDTLILIRKTN